MAEEEEAKIREKLYKLLLGKYSDYINLQEQKTISELKELANPRNQVVASTAEKLRQESKSDFEYIKLAFDYINTFPAIHAPTQVLYWLKPEEIIELGAGEELDKAIFLIALLRAGKISDARVVVSEDANGLKHAFVLIRHGNTAFIADVGGKLHEGQNEEKLWKEFAEAKKITRRLYAFNDETYEEYEEYAQKEENSAPPT